MALDQWKSIVDIIGTLFAVLVGTPAALLAYKRWFRPADIGVSLDSVLLLGPGAESHIKSQSILVTAQLRLYNAGAMPESISNISLFDLHLAQRGQSVSYTAYAALKPLKMTSQKANEPARFHLEPTELAHSFVLKSEDQIVLHFLFFPDQDQQLDPQAGELKLTFALQAETSQRKALKLKPLVRCVTLTDEDVRTLGTNKKLGFLSWNLTPC